MRPILILPTHRAGIRPDRCIPCDSLATVDGLHWFKVGDRGLGEGERGLLDESRWRGGGTHTSSGPLIEYLGLSGCGALGPGPVRRERCQH